MSKKYPYTLDQPCPVCQSPIVITRKRKKIPEYCSVDCYNSTIQKHSKIITNRTCPQCHKVFRHHKNRYCSKKCSNVHRAKPGPVKYRTCLHCNKEYKLDKLLGNNRSKYCSNLCFTQDRIAKYLIDPRQIEVNYYLLGQLWATSLVKDLLEIRFYGSKEILESILFGLKSNYPIKPTRPELHDNFFITRYSVKLFNRELVQKLLDLGLNEPHYREWPLINNNFDWDFFRGYLDSIKILQKESERWVWMISRPMAYETESKFGGRVWYEAGDWWWISNN